MPLPEHRKCITSPRCSFVPLAFVHTAFLWHTACLYHCKVKAFPEKLLEDTGSEDALVLVEEGFRSLNSNRD
jgi:hypothetical protein